MYELTLVDSDTGLFRACKFVQEDFVVVKNNITEEVVEFPTQTSFWGHHGKKVGGWLAEENIKRDLLGLPAYTPEDFTMSQVMSRLKPDIENHIEKAIENFDLFVGKVKAAGYSKDYRLFIGGEGNFRYAEAELIPYKHGRSDKPIVFQEVKERIIKKYKSKIILAYDVETDDKLSEWGWVNYQHYKQTGEWRWLLGYVDKDLKQIISPYYNPYDEEDKSITVPTPFDCAKAFATQCLMGDKNTDNIQGLKGIGEAKAAKILEGATNPKELFERVVEAYKSFYGIEKKEVEGHRGVLNWNYLDFLQDSANLLWLRRKDEKFCIGNFLDKLGVEYER